MTNAATIRQLTDALDEARIALSHQAQDAETIRNLSAAILREQDKVAVLTFALKASPCSCGAGHQVCTRCDALAAEV